MRKVMFALALYVLTLVATAAVPYPHVQASAAFSDPTPGAKSVSVRIHLHNTGDMAASCTVKLGGQTKITGVSASGDAYVFFDGVRAYKGYTLACQTN